MIKTYFYHFAFIHHIGNGHIQQPVMYVHAVAPAGTASAVALTSIRFTCSAAIATHEKNE
jgi:hypothetical protein